MKIFLTAKMLQKYFKEYYYLYNYKSVCSIKCVNETKKLYFNIYEYNKFGFDYESEIRKLYDLHHPQLNVYKIYKIGDVEIFLRFSVDSFKDNVFYEIKKWKGDIIKDYNLEFFSLYKKCVLISKNKEYEYKPLNVNFEEKLKYLVEDYKKTSCNDCYVFANRKEDFDVCKGKTVYYDGFLYIKDTFGNIKKSVEGKYEDLEEYFYRDCISFDEFLIKYK